MNYYDKISDNVELLWHFPYPDFKAFKEAVEKGEVVNTGIPMDYARQWVTQGVSAPKGWMIFSNILLFLPYLLTIFYIVTAFISRNYWLILYSVIPIIFMFFFNPLARKAFKMHYYFIGIYVLAGIFIKSLWEPIYWLPLVVDYLALNQLYEGSAQLVRENLHKNEKLLCWFWKRGNLQIELKDGSKWSDRYIERDGETEFYEDVDKEWKEYIDKNSSSDIKGQSNEKDSDTAIDPKTIEAIKLIYNSKYDKVSPSLFQRRLEIDYTRADKIINTLVQFGLVDSKSKEEIRDVNSVSEAKLQEIKTAISRLPIYEIKDEPVELNNNDPLYSKAVQIAQTEGVVSAALLQKKLSIGYARAARLFDILVENGVIVLDKPEDTTRKTANNTNPIFFLIQNTLEAFGIFVKGVDIVFYKDFKEYRFELAVGTSIEQLTERAPDIAIAVASPTGKIKIHAPIPGTSLVGIIVPNSKMSKINLKSKPLSRESI